MRKGLKKVSEPSLQGIFIPLGGFCLFIADVINMFRLQGVCDSIKSPLTPLFEKGGNAYTPVSFVATMGVLILLQAFMSSPFDIKGGQGDLIKRPIGTYF